MMLVLQEETHYVPVNRNVLHDDHTGFADCQRDKFEDFDYDAVDLALGNAAEELDEGDAEALGSRLRKAWPIPGDLVSARKMFSIASMALRDKPGGSRGRVAFGNLLDWCWRPGGQRPASAEEAFHFWVASCATLDPRLVASKNYATLARDLGLTKAAISKAARDFRERFGFHFHEWRNAAGRQRMHDARMAQRTPDGRVAGRHFKAKAPDSSRQPGP